MHVFQYIRQHFAQLGRNVFFHTTEKKSEFLNPEMKTQVEENK